MTRVRILSIVAIVLGLTSATYGEPQPEPKPQPTSDRPSVAAPQPDANLGRPQVIRPQGRPLPYAKPHVRRHGVVAPPAGTLGYTYRRRSYDIPRDKHPRDGMLIVDAPGASTVDVEGMKGFYGDDGKWHFQSERPLIPGIPHIYQAEAAYQRDGKIDVDVLVFRLIPGRIVTLDFPAHGE